MDPGPRGVPVGGGLGLGPREEPVGWEGWGQAQGEKTCILLTGLKHVQLSSKIQLYVYVDVHVYVYSYA